MRYILLLFLASTIAFIATANGPAFSQRSSDDYCDNADSTAATFDCVNKRKVDAQENLNTIYRALLEIQTEEARARLTESQKDWIIYRDAHCKWESGLTEKPGLERVYELSCITQLTEKRSALLDTIKTQAEITEPREFGAQPRWMTALSMDYPDIFWRYGDWQAADMDCDGIDEQIMTGLSVAHTQEAVIIKEDDGIQEDIAREISLIVAISENPDVGRPKAFLNTIQIKDESEDIHLCRPDVKITVKNIAGDTEESDTSEALENKGCTTYLEISDKICAPVHITWQENDYTISNPQNTEDTF